MRRHCRWQTLPTGERMALLYRICFGSERSAELNFKRFVLRAINLINQIILVHGVGTLYLYVTGWHRSRNILPTGERVTLLGGCFGSGDGITEDKGLGLNNSLTNLEDSLVGIDGKVSCHLHIMRRHCRWQTLPTGERMTLLYGIWFCRKRSAKLYLDYLILRTINLIGNGVLVHGVRTQHLYVTSRHCFRNILPTGERVTLLGGCLWSSNGIAEDNGLGIDDFITNLEDCLVGIDGEVSCHLHIMRRHCRRQTLPTGERMTLLYGIGFGSERSAVEHIRLLIGFPVKGIGKMVL